MPNSILAYSQTEQQIYHGGRGHVGICKEEKNGKSVKNKKKQKYN
jgi:hypothetical protein